MLVTHFGFDPVWLGVVIGVNLQTSFLTPPFGFALFYLRGVVSSDDHLDPDHLPRASSRSWRSSSSGSRS